ncbi:unnamed protein product [Penicillium bialowiezense]
MEPSTGESSQPHRSPASTNRTPHRVCNLHEPESKCQLHSQEASVKLFLSRITSLRRNNPPTCLRSHHRRDYKLYQMAWNQSHASGDRTASPTVFEQQREELVREIAVNQVGNEFSSVEALWSQFENFMGRPEEEGEEQGKRKVSGNEAIKEEHESGSTAMQ